MSNEFKLWKSMDCHASLAMMFQMKRHCNEEDADGKTARQAPIPDTKGLGPRTEFPSGGRGLFLEGRKT